MASQLDNESTSSEEMSTQVMDFDEATKESLFREESREWLNENAHKLFQLEVARFLARERKKQNLTSANYRLK